MMNTPVNTTSCTDTPKRLLSLDILRGFDLACLVLVQPILYVWLSILNPGEETFGGKVMGQITHVPWEGFCFWDIIMPLFMFMSGITIPFAMSRYKTGKEKVDRRFYVRILRRFVVLWVVGAIIQGNLLEFDIRQLHLYSNTLQSIAVGYVVVTFLYIFTSLRTQLTVVSLLFVAYIAIFVVWGNMDFTIDANICEEIDRKVLGHFRDGVIWNGDSWTWNPTYHYTWIMSSLNFVVTVFTGYMAGYILRGSSSMLDKFLKLLITGVGLIAVSLLMSLWIPIIKHIWSSSMTLFASGICFILMALFYFVVDIKGWIRGLGWLKVYGVNSLVAYFLGEAVNFDSITNSFFHGFEQWMGVYYPVLVVTMHGIFIFIILTWMYRMRIFVKA